MNDKLQFIHQFKDQSADGCLSIDTDTSGNQRVQVEVDEQGSVWLAANRDGWLHLARICAELGLGSYESGYHFHKTWNFKTSDGSGPEISLGVDEE